MELEQKPKCSSSADESSYHGPKHVRLCHSIHTKLLQRQPYMYDCHIYTRTKKHISILNGNKLWSWNKEQNVAHNLTKNIIQAISVPGGHYCE